METCGVIETALNQCCSTECYRFNVVTKAAKMVYTDGVKLMADMCEAWWLIDAIASYQSKCMKDEMLRYMQFWTLTVKDRKAVLKCERDSDDVFLTQEIPFTDFPLEEMKIWLEPGETSFGNGLQTVMVAMLPSER